MSWSKRILDWTEGDTAYLSVVFTWQLPQAYSKAVWYRQQGYRVVAGGPAVSLMPEYLSPVSSDHGPIPCLHRHNPAATRTSTGCVWSCRFCAVPITEGDIVELSTWAPRPIICDNNLTATSRAHFDKVIDSLRKVKGVDVQGLDCSLFNAHHLERLRELDLKVLRFGFDNVNLENRLFDALKACVKAGIPRSKLAVYVLVGFEDTPADASYRLQALKDFGVGNNAPMRFQPIRGLQALVKDSYLAPGWTEHEMRRLVRYWFRQAWFRKIPFAEFRG